MAEPEGKEDKAMMDGMSKAEDDGKGSEEGCGCELVDEGFPLLPLNKLIKSYKSLAFPPSIVKGTGEILSTSSSK